MFEDVTKVHEQIVNALGHDRAVNPNQIFAKLELLVKEESSVRVKKVVEDIISEHEPARTRLKSSELKDNAGPNDEEEHAFGSENEDMDMDEDNLLNSKGNNGEAGKGVEMEAGVDLDSLRSTPASIISITDEER